MNKAKLFFKKHWWLIIVILFVAYILYDKFSKVPEKLGLPKFVTKREPMSPEEIKYQNCLEQQAKGEKIGCVKPQ